MAATRKFSDEELQTALKAVNGSYSEAARILGVSREAVWYRASEKGKLSAESKKKFPDRNQEVTYYKILWNHIWGVPARESAKKLEYTEWYISNILRKEFGDIYHPIRGRIKPRAKVRVYKPT